MSNIALKVENVSKLYRLGVKEQAHDSFGRTVLDYIKSPLSNYKKYRSLYRFDDVLTKDGGSAQESASNVIWALNDVSFEVEQGDVVGIIGHNGAGKSTLLKVLSRITPPTKGRIEIRGRVSSLLEVGTGFHPELTGRENVFLNGTILGMRKKEIEARFDEIVEFSGVEKFLDTPVKRYSSGMRVRLAFSVAAHLEPEILIVDEVLAVGDAEFQKKCLNKMQDVGSEGRTVLFVSHSMPAISRLCERVIMIGEGTVMHDGPTDKVVSAYLHDGGRTKSLREWPDLSKAPGDDVVRLCGMRIRDRDGSLMEGLDIRKEVGLEMEFEVLKNGHQLMPYYTVMNEEGMILFSSIDQGKEWWGRERTPGRFTVRAWIPGNILTEGTYYIRATMRTTDRKKRHFDEMDVIAFSVMDSMDGDSARGEWVGRMRGVIRPRLEWDTSYEPGVPVTS